MTNWPFTQGDLATSRTGVQTRGQLVSHLGARSVAGMPKLNTTYQRALAITLTGHPQAMGRELR